MSYQPTYIKAYETGLVQNRQNFILPEDAFPVLENAFVWRERIRRKQGVELLGRLRRVLTSQSLGNTVAAQKTYTLANIFASFIPPVGATEPNKSIEPGSLVISIAAPDTATFTDNGLGGFTVTGVGVAAGSSVNYATGAVTLVLSAAVGGSAITAAINYFPGLPVMGLRSRELNNINNEMLIAFDTIYAYRYITGSGWIEFIPGTTWKGNDSSFFWSTNFWTSNNLKLFWVTNFSGTTGDPIRYTDGATWTNFTPTINASGDVLAQCLCILPFRGRLLTFNTLEGANLAASNPFFQRIRWSAIGNPLLANAWRDDIRGQGGFLDIPTAENIVSVGFVRDNLVIYCESSTWQLRYTGRSISPFQIEKVNTELGAESTFSAVQFDTSLVGIGDKGIVECDSFKSNRIDIKIPDLIFQFSNDNDGPKRVHGIRDFFNRLAFWTYPYKPDEGTGAKFPNRRLCYNYENDSWAIFTDSFTCFGNYQPQLSRNWATSKFSWQTANFSWIDRPSLFPAIVGGNQQGYVLILDQNTTNEQSLTIESILGQTTLATSIKSTNHNLETGYVIQIRDIPAGTPFASSLNGNVFGVVKTDANNFLLYKYDAVSGQFSQPQLDVPATYIGGGQIVIRDNFSIVSKKFNFTDQGQTIAFGYCDILVNTTSEFGAFSMNVYLDYADDQPVNIKPENQDPVTLQEDTFFNSIVPTTSNGGLSSSKQWVRVYCPVRASFITLEYTFNNSQMAGNEHETDVQIDAQVVWIRPAGSQLPFGL